VRRHRASGILVYIVVVLVAMLAIGGIALFLFASSNGVRTPTSESSTSTNATSQVGPASGSNCVGVGGGSLFDSFNGLVYLQVQGVASHGPYTAVINGTNLEGSIPGAGPMLCDPTDGYVYMLQLKPGQQSWPVLVVDGLRVLANLTLAEASYFPWSPVGPMAYEPFNQFVYVAVNGIFGNSLMVLRGTSLVANLTLNDLHNPVDAIAVDTRNGLLYIGGSFPTMVVNGSTVEYNINHTSATLMLFNPTNGFVYASNLYNTSVISGSSVIATLPANDFGGGDVSCLYYCTYQGPLEYDSHNGYVYIAGTNNAPGGFNAPGMVNELFVVDNSSVAATIITHNLPVTMLDDQLNHDLYLQMAFGQASNSQTTNPNATVSVVSGTRIVANLTFAGNFSAGMFVNPVNGYVYVFGFISPPTGGGVSNTTLAVVSNEAILKTIEMKGQAVPHSSVVDPATDRFYFLLQSSSSLGTNTTLVIVSGSTVQAQINLSS